MAHALEGLCTSAAGFASGEFLRFRCVPMYVRDGHLTDFESLTHLWDGPDWQSAGLGGNIHMDYL